MTALDRAIEDHRALYRADIDFNPTQRTPPVAYTWDEERRMMVPDDRPLVINPLTANEVTVPDGPTQSTQVGMPISGRMLRYLMGPTHDTPWATALKALRVYCRRHHEFHRAADRPYWRGSLCHQLVVFTIMRDYSLLQASGILRYDHPEPILREALAFIEQTLDDFRAKAEKRERELAGHGPGAVPVERPGHHAVPGLHEIECPQCRRNAA